MAPPAMASSSLSESRLLSRFNLISCDERMRTIHIVWLRRLGDEGSDTVIQVTGTPDHRHNSAHPGRALGDRLAQDARQQLHRIGFLNQLKSMMSVFGEHVAVA